LNLFQNGTSSLCVLRIYENLLKSIDFANKITYNEYNSSGYLISTIIKNVSRNPICEYKWIGEKM